MLPKHPRMHILAAAGAALLLASLGCGQAAATQPPVPTSTQTVEPIPFPTILPEPTASLTPLPTTVVRMVSAADPGISMKPQTGEPRDVVMVSGTGWPPGAPVALHWGTATGPTGKVYWTVTADASGAFSVGLIVPPRGEWPTYLPPEFTILQLRATTPNIIGRYYWANFTYIPRPTPTVDVAAHPTATITCPTCW